VPAVVARPVFTVNQPVIDFGDVAADSLHGVTISFRNESGAPAFVVAPPPDPGLPFDQLALMMMTEVAPGEVTKVDVEVHAFVPGDYSTTLVWVATSAPVSELPEGCTGTVSVNVHARLVAPDGGTDGADGPP
jgi:hypothetical protein